ncbi:MAG: 4Fe-4S binding protein [Candidatus Omnitrophota bacterium]
MRRKYFLNIIILITILMAIGVNIYQRDLSDNEISDESIASEGHTFNTKDIAPEVKGLGGHIEMLVELERAGSIKDIRVLAHSETSQYASGITEPGFLDQFKGRSVRDGFIVGEDIDAVTHATISSKAVARTLETCLQKIDAVKHDREYIREDRQALNLDMDFYITASLITLLLIAFYLSLNWLRYTGLFISIVYFGFCKANFISMSNLGNIFLWRLPDPGSNIAWYVFIASGLILTFLLGGFYCSYMCPFGGLQIFLNKIFRSNIDITPALARTLRRIKYFLLWILIILLLVLGNSNIVNYEPFSTVFLRRGSIVAWAIALIILTLSLFHYRPFCSYFCAAGAFLEILTKLGRKVFRRT